MQGARPADPIPQPNLNPADVEMGATLFLCSRADGRDERTEARWSDRDTILDGPRFQTLDAVSNIRRTFELEPTRMLLHLPLELL